MILGHIDARRIIAKPLALDAATWPADSVALRLAADDVLLIADGGGSGDGPVSVADEHAIIEEDAGWSGAWLTSGQAAGIAVHHIHWPLPTERPVLAQGLVAGIPTKLWLEPNRALLLVASVSVEEMQERLS